MVEPIAQVVLALPVAIALAPGGMCQEETRWIAFCCQLLQTRLTRVLRFQSGKARLARNGYCTEFDLLISKSGVRPGFACVGAACEGDQDEPRPSLPSTTTIDRHISWYCLHVSVRCACT